MQNAAQFILNQSQAVMKQIVSEYPYEPLHDQPHGVCLKTESSEVGKRLVEVLQSKVHVAGAKILSFQFNELSYAPEVCGLCGVACLCGGLSSPSFFPTLHPLLFFSFSQIASGMLKKQQAMATVAARTTIVQGAVEIAYGAITMLEQKGIVFDNAEKTKMVGNLLTVIW